MYDNAVVNYGVLLMSDLKNTDKYQVVWLIRRLFRSMGSYTNSYLEDLGISAAERAVMEFLVNDEKLSVPDIAGKYQVSRQHIQVNVNALLEKGLVMTENNPKHRRSQLIVLTKKGKRYFERVLAKDTEAINMIFSHISESECKQIHKNLKKMYINLTEGE
jgi:DNA-binding MarR family transcriptional regulator